jgi:hypothetical protein
MWTGGRTNTGCLGIRIVYPNGATCLPVDWRKSKPGCLGIRIVYPNGATCLPVNWRKNKHWLSWNQDSVSELCRSIGIHYPDSETTSLCSSSSPLVDMSLHWDTLSWFRDNQCLFSLQSTGRHVAPFGYSISDMSTSGLEEEPTLVVSESG